MLESPTSSPQPAANPPTSKVTQADIEIVRRVEAILDSPTKWDRASTDHCQPTAKTFGLYCAFEAALMAVAGKFDALISRTAPIGIMSTHFHSNKPLTTGGCEGVQVGMRPLGAG